MKTTLIVQARSASKRLPNKALLPLAGEPMLFRVIERLRRCTSCEAVVLATTVLPEDDPLADIAREHGCFVFRGSENDLVDRICGAADMVQADVIVRYPSDNALPEPYDIDRIVGYFLENKCDFASNLCNVQQNGYPEGIGAEVYRRTSLELFRREEKDPWKREHITPCFYDYSKDAPAAPASFRIGTVSCPESYRRPNLKMCVDTADEYTYIARMYEDLYPLNPLFGIADVISWHSRIAASRIG
jgi:spore coat polysaccharide biosynthesis protein SpsF